MVTLRFATVTQLKLCPATGCSEGRTRREGENADTVFADVTLSTTCDADVENECSEKTTELGNETTKLCGDNKCRIKSSNVENLDGDDDDSAAKSLTVSVLLVLAAYIFA